jgi:dipeptidyl aminopeptidase/acylaminoacyl peptidase
MSTPHRLIAPHPVGMAMLGLAAAAASGAEPAATAARPTVAFTQVSLSPDGRQLATVEGQNVSHGGEPVVRSLVIRRTDGSGSLSVPLPCPRARGCWPSSPAWTPDSRQLTFALRDPDSHARSLYQVNADGSGLALLLEFNGTIQGLRYSPDGQLAMLAIEAAHKEVGATEAGVAITGDLDAAPPEQRIAVLADHQLHWVSPPDLFVYEYDWLPDGRGFVGTAAPGDGDRNWWVAKLYAFDLDAGSPRLLYAPASAQQQLAEPRVSPDGRRVAFIGGLMSDFGATGGDLYTVPLAGGAATAVTPGLPASVTAVRWNCRGHLEAITLAGAQTQLVDFGSGLDAGTGSVLWHGEEYLGGMPSTIDSASAAACPANLEARVHQSFNQPVEVELGPPGHWRDFTHLNQGLATHFPVRSVSWTHEGYHVQGWLLLPETPAGRPPLITVVHGGPAAASQPRFIGAGPEATLVRHGYALFLPNPRGSFGEGEAFVAANVRDFGYGDLRDILAGLDAVAALGLTDPQRLGLMGGSYGGFMTMWAVTQTDRFKAAMAGAGISNWLSYYGENGIDEWMIPFFGASAYDAPDAYERSSAIHFIRQVHTPVFSFVGSNDIECPASQTLEFGHALKTLGKPAMTVIYPDEGHRLHEPEHLADLDARMLAWFDRYLK